MLTFSDLIGLQFWVQELKVARTYRNLVSSRGLLYIGPHSLQNCEVIAAETWPSLGSVDVQGCPKGPRTDILQA